MKKLLISALCLVAMWSCSTDDPATPESQAGDMYMQLSLKMETKSGTNENGGSNANPGTEVGKEHENAISTVDIVLKPSKGGACVVAEQVVPSNAGTATYVASFNTDKLIGGDEYTVYIYANCNAPVSTNGELNLDEVSDATIGNMTTRDHFWMTNAYTVDQYNKTLPSDLSLYNVPQNPYNLGTYYVERSMARFDYMPINDNKYTIAEGTTITLTEAALINQSKNHYMLRRVSTDGTGANWVIGGTEIKTNYVVDTDWEAKQNGFPKGNTELDENFNYHMSAPSTWEYKPLPTGADGDVADSWDGTSAGTTGATGSNHELNDYYLWQYAKENTIPGVPAQDKGITTGVVFKGKITGDAVTAANGGMIYVFENVLYGNWAAVEAAANADNAPATLVAAVNKIKAIATPAAADYAAAGFTGYNRDTDGNYYAYYYYWNRHNDNGDNTVMGPMEFAVVRNNVYKLCVDKIAKFGHPDPKDPTNPDPDPENPDDPDEDKEYYFTVTVKVLPWVVRVNHIEF